MFKCLNAKKLKCKSFSLIEVMVAITVITVGLVGVAGLIVYNISIARASPERVIAVNLAQEGIEAVRNIRDSNWLAGDPWNQDFDVDDDYYLHVEEADDLTQGWELNSVTGDPEEIQVYYDPTYHYYGQRNPPARPSRWEETNFTRWIEINNISTDQVQVISRVDWTDRSGNPHTVTLEDHLYDYRIINPQDLYHWEYIGRSAFRGSCQRAFCDVGTTWQCGTDTTQIWGWWLLLGRDLYCNNFPLIPNQPEQCKLHGSSAFGTDPACLYDDYTFGDLRYQIYNKVKD